MITLYDTEFDCCGCSACEAICPRQNIVMKPNTDGGYLYPIYLGDDNCINCKLCLSVCPIKTQKKPSDVIPPIYYAGITKDKNIWKTSTSGGVFSEICNLYEEKKPIVFGARWGENFEIVMDYAEDLIKAAYFRKSKYVAANVNRSFPIVKKFLDDGRYVIWGGTPCQVNGLKNYLRKEYDNLITVDFACHGQGSPDVFKAWINYLGKKYGSRVVRFKFRERKFIKDHINSNCTGYELEDGRNVLVTRDYYHHAFVYGWHIRKSCQKCDFANKRMADITLADFKSKERKAILKPTENASDIIANTVKGNDICERLKSRIRMYTPSFEMEELANPKIIKRLPGNARRDLFMKDFYNGMPIDKVIKKYARILPSQWLEYNTSEMCFQMLSKPVSYLDELFKKVFSVL